MIDQRVVDYIQTQIKNGYKLEAIKTALIQRGYNEASVNECVAFVQSNGSQIDTQSTTQSNLINTNQTGNIAQMNGDAQVINMSNPRYVGFWARVGAYLLDAIVVGIPAWLIQMGLILLTEMNSLVYVVSFISLSVLIYFEGIKGGTPGKLIIGIRVVNEKGEYIGIPMAFLRYVGKILSGLILGIGYFMIGWDDKKQGLHDKIAKTYVVEK